VRLEPKVKASVAGRWCRFVLFMMIIASQLPAHEHEDWSGSYRATARTRRGPPAPAEQFEAGDRVTYFCVVTYLQR